MATSLTELLGRRVAADPDAVVVVDGDRSMTYRELDARAAQFANALAADGVEPGDRVAFLSKNSAEFFEFLFGAARRRVVGVPLNFRLHPQETARILADAGAKLLVVSQDFRGQLEEIAAGAGCVERVLVVGGDGELSYEAWRDRQSTKARELPETADGVVLFLYTSGTTGTPKGVMVSDDNWNTTVRTHEEAYALSPTSVQLFVLPLFHIGGLLIAVLAVAAGARTVLLADADPVQMIRSAEQHRVTHMPVIPVLLKAIVDLLELPEHRDADLSNLETMLYGATAMPESILRAAMEKLGPIRYMSGYGMTETAASMTLMLPEDHDLSNEQVSARLRSVGRPSSESEVRVVDPETLEDLPPGKAGEVLVRSPQVMIGYWNRPEETAHALLADGWFRTGDGGYLDEDGYLFLTDRIKDMVITGGENVYPAEIEHLLVTLPGVREVAVIGVPDERWGETPRAVIVRAPDATLTEDEVIGFCRDRLARYKCPTSVTWTDELPRTPSGKVMKHVLRSKYSG